jgi:hypothetical protein
LFVAEHLLGSGSAWGPTSFSRNGALAGSLNCVDGASSLNTSYSDSGLFGMSIEGAGSHSQELMSHLTD